MLLISVKFSRLARNACAKLFRQQRLWQFVNPIAFAWAVAWPNMQKWSPAFDLLLICLFAPILLWQEITATKCYKGN
ncbi:MAG: hypothetical protein EDM05_017730 [Leptolyngbya sp. IPPAS B-1204]|nr:MAG: hypothetical protein EDM05_07780 [Leptolyngbya sp. IPPAS B-1204]